MIKMNITLKNKTQALTLGKKKQTYTDWFLSQKVGNVFSNVPCDLVVEL